MNMDYGYIIYFSNNSDLPLLSDELALIHLELTETSKIVAFPLPPLTLTEFLSAIDDNPWMIISWVP